MSRVRIPIGKDRYITVFTADEVEKKISLVEVMPGPIGPTGVKGDKGDQGLQGIQGVQGLKGDKGDAGIQGIQGIKGDTGSQGIQGVKGDTGTQGIQGVPGTDATVTNANVISAIGFTPANSTHNHDAIYQKQSIGALPVASLTYRGQIRSVQGATGVADRYYMCVKKADDTYAWVDMLGMSYGY